MIRVVFKFFKYGLYGDVDNVREAAGSITELRNC
jgi:hypothetical protein